jgi:hypothetical protein
MSESLEQPPHADPPVNEKSSNGDHMDTDKAPESTHVDHPALQNGDNADSHTNGGMKRHSPDHEEDNSEERNAKRAREDHSVSFNLASSVNPSAHLPLLDHLVRPHQRTAKSMDLRSLGLVIMLPARMWSK